MHLLLRMFLFRIFCCLLLFQCSTLPNWRLWTESGCTFISNHSDFFSINYFWSDDLSIFSTQCTLTSCSSCFTRKQMCLFGHSMTSRQRSARAKRIFIRQGWLGLQPKSRIHRRIYWSRNKHSNPVSPASRFTSQVSEPTIFTLFMSTPNGTVTLKNLGSQSTIVDVKNCVAMKWSNTNFSVGYDISGQIQLICHEINWDEWYLSFHGKPLRDHLSLVDLNINNESTIQLMGRMHGAGKKARIPLRDLTNIRTPSSTTSVPTELKDQCQLLTSTPDPTGESKVQCELPLVSTPESKLLFTE